MRDWMCYPKIDRQYCMQRYKTSVWITADWSFYPIHRSIYCNWPNRLRINCFERYWETQVLIKSLSSKTENEILTAKRLSVTNDFLPWYCLLFFNALFIWQPWLKLFPLQSNKEIKIKFNLTWALQLWKLFNSSWLPWTAAFFPGLIEFSLILTAFKSAYTAERLTSEEGYNVIEKALRNKP